MLWQMNPMLLAAANWGMGWQDRRAYQDDVRLETASSGSHDLLKNSHQGSIPRVPCRRN